MRNIALLVTLVAGLGIFAGCGPSGPKVVQVSGQVTYKGKPVPRLSLGFTPDSGRPSTGNTDKDGKFELMYEEPRKGAQVGSHSVAFGYLANDPGEEMAILEGKRKRPPEVEAILQKYGTGKTPLKIEIKEATNNLEIKLD